MAFQAAKEFLEKRGFGDRIKEFDVSSATVELAAVAVGCEPAHIAKTLSFLTGEGPVLIVAAGDAKIDNHKYKSFFGVKAKMLTVEQVSELIGHDYASCFLYSLFHLLISFFAFSNCPSGSCFHRALKFLTLAACLASVSAWDSFPFHSSFHSGLKRAS